MLLEMLLKMSGSLLNIAGSTLRIYDLVNNFVSEHALNKELEKRKGMPCFH